MSKTDELTRRKLAKLTGAGITAGLAGCSGSGDGGDGGDGGPSDVEQLSLLTWNIKFLEESINGWFDDFQSTEEPVTADYSNTEITWIDRAASDVPTYYQSQLQSGDPVNIIDTQSAVYTRFASDGVFAPLDDLVSEDFLSQIGEQALEFSRLDGELYRIPFYQNCSSTYLRNQWFDEAGLEPPETTEEFFDTSRALVEDSGAEFGMTFVTFNYRIWPFFWAEDIDVLNDDQSAAAFNTDRAVEIVERFRQQTSDGIIPEVTWTGRVEEQSNQFGAGDTGMFITPLASIRRVQSAGDWVTPDSFSLSIPPGNNGAYQAHGLSITSIDSSDAEQQASWDLIRVIMSAKWQEDFLRNTTVIAGNTAIQDELANDEEFQENNPLKTMAYDLWPTLTDGYVTPPRIPEASEIANTLDSQISSAALGEKGPQQALDDAEQQVNNVLSN
jgi:ABC-type glycerol-3-phosphate transport system substrate-binding protein